MADWNPEHYRTFEAQRDRPFFDLIDLLPPKVGGAWLDLGCGDGRLIRMAADRLGASEVVGVDSSPAMIEAARRAGGDARFSWREEGIEEVLDSGERYDLVLCNAALHFVPDHPAVVPRLLGLVAPGGWIAVQMPFNHVARTHLLAEAAATSEELVEHLGGARVSWPQERPEVYARQLKQAGFEWPLVQLRTYRRALEGSAAIVSWMRSAGLRPWLDAFGPEHEAAFLEKYERLIHHAYPAYGDDLRLLDYTRLFFVGYRPAGA
jgi:trans-aconitate 2-methyltransferase